MFLECGTTIPMWYRSEYSTEDAILKLTQDLSTALSNNEQSAAVFLDHIKAFDCVQHDVFLEKLARMGFGKHSVSLLANYVSSCKQCLLEADPARRVLYIREPTMTLQCGHGRNRQRLQRN